MKKNNTQALEIIKQRIIDEKVCPELAKSATQLVFADGNPEADIVFIGEAPGKNEDQQGLPFVGAAGKFLNEMLAMIGLARADIYITNIVKYRPPNNRDPLPEEKKAFWPYLVRQLDVIRPKLVVTLGRHSMEYFLPEARISQIHGKPKRLHWHIGRSGGKDQLSNTTGSASGKDELVFVLLPLFHPAAALYNGAMRQTLIDDFARIPTILQKLTKDS